MGTRARQKQERLAEKLLQIRIALGLSQNGMIRHLGVEIGQNTISEYELGKREPSLRVLLLYAKAVNVSTDVLIDDELDLPAKLPSKAKYKR
jgi:transcriptional regulator with XRE-family HTH domain